MTQERMATGFAMLSGGAAVSAKIEMIHTLMQIGAAAISMIAGAITIVMWAIKLWKYFKEREEQ